MRPGSRSVQSWDGKRQPASSLIPQLCDHMAYSTDAADSEPDEAEEENAKPKKAEILPPKPKAMNDRWLEKVPENKEGAWRLQFHVIHKSFKRSIVFGIVEADHGKEAIRIMRILDSWGRLEEKGVSRRNARSYQQADVHFHPTGPENGYDDGKRRAQGL
jgi:hypothetical protein